MKECKGDLQPQKRTLCLPGQTISSVTSYQNYLGCFRKTIVAEFLCITGIKYDFNFYLLMSYPSAKPQQAFPGNLLVTLAKDQKTYTPLFLPPNLVSPPVL